MADTEPRVRAAGAAKELRETQRAFDDLRAALVAKLLGSPVEATQTREKCYHSVNALDAVRTALEAIVEGGRLEEAIEELTRGPAKPESAFVHPIRGAA